MAQSTTVDSGASGSKSLKQSPGWKSSGPTPSSGSAPRLAGADDVVAAAGRGRIRDRLLAAAAQRRQPPDQQAHDDDGGRGGAEPHGALAAQPAAQLRGLLRGRLARPCEGAACGSRGAWALPGAGSRAARRRAVDRRYAAGGRPAVRTAPRLLSGLLNRSSPGAAAGTIGVAEVGGVEGFGGTADGTAGADRSPGPPAGGTPGRPAPLGLSFSSVTENSPLSCVFAAAGRPAEGPVSGSPLRNSI